MSDNSNKTQAMDEHNAAVDRYRTAVERLRGYAKDHTGADDGGVAWAIGVVLARRDDIDNTVCWGVACPHEAKALDNDYAHHATQSARIATLEAERDAARAEVAAAYEAAATEATLLRGCDIDERVVEHCRFVRDAIRSLTPTAARQALAALVAAAVGEEREECAKECDALIAPPDDGSNLRADIASEAAHELAARIRARSAAKRDAP